MGYFRKILVIFGKSEVAQNLATFWATFEKQMQFFEKIYYSKNVAIFGNILASKIFFPFSPK
jgi:hypothetical protein